MHLLRQLERKYHKQISPILSHYLLSIQRLLKTVQMIIKLFYIPLSNIQYSSIETMPLHFPVNSHYLLRMNISQNLQWNLSFTGEQNYYMFICYWASNRHTYNKYRSSVDRIGDYMTSSKERIRKVVICCMRLYFVLHCISSIKEHF